MGSLIQSPEYIDDDKEEKTKELFKDFSLEDDDSYYTMDGFDPNAVSELEEITYAL